MRILLTIVFCSIDSPFIFILFTIVNVLPRKVSIFSPSFMVSNSNSLLKACNCALFTFVEPWYFCFMDSQIALEVPLSRIVSRISLQWTGTRNSWSSNPSTSPLLQIYFAPHSPMLFRSISPESHLPPGSTILCFSEILHRHGPKIIMAIKFWDGRLYKFFRFLRHLSRSLSHTGSCFDTKCEI